MNRLISESPVGMPNSVGLIGFPKFDVLRSLTTDAVLIHCDDFIRVTLSKVSQVDAKILETLT